MPSAHPIHDNRWPAHGPANMETGVRWNAVRVPAETGREVLVLIRKFELGSRIGPVIADHSAWWFLVSPASGSEPWPPNTTYLTTGNSLTVPPQHSTPDDTALRWIKPPRLAPGHEYTDTLTLRTCLEVISERRSLAGHLVRDEFAHQVSVPYTSVRLQLRTGIGLLDLLRGSGGHIGPVMVCRSHGILHILVPPDEADALPRVPGVIAVTEGSTDCGYHGKPRRWLLPPADEQRLTRADTLTAAMLRHPPQSPLTAHRLQQTAQPDVPRKTSTWPS
ncbi:MULTISPECIES: hypothetical protein [unclassified Streptomyces]|uniref:hypothetical protein n=1 Tax=unclassified Streptomyces TaxID=2593676 RepID=UPI00081D9C60|nr:MULTISPECIES: hypothetical protein [unclassified Streptomyces]MYZ40724.1 hypothetical protein [Streptomyces sp. SID4917]SCG08447.1 hypothetical protein GA0115259_112964 [Streptomyces sp. MnatMP-M17]